MVKNSLKGLAGTFALVLSLGVSQFAFAEEFAGFGSDIALETASLPDRSRGLFGELR